MTVDERPRMTVLSGPTGATVVRHGENRRPFGGGWGRW